MQGAGGRQFVERRKAPEEVPRRVWQGADRTMPTVVEFQDNQGL